MEKDRLIFSVTWAASSRPRCSPLERNGEGVALGGLGASFDWFELSDNVQLGEGLR